MHKRSEIKSLVYNMLLNKTDAKDSISVNRFLPIQHDKDFPSIAIYFLSENVVEERTSTTEILAKLSIAIFTRSQRYIEDLSDKIADQIMIEISKYRSNEFEFSYTGMDTEGDGANRSTDLVTILNYEVSYIQEVNADFDADLISVAGTIDLSNAKIEFEEE